MFHSSNPSLFGRPEGVLAETRALESTIIALRDISVSLRTHDAAAKATAGDVLADFSARLSLYFDAEESSGYFDTIAREDSRLGSRVADLESMHDELRDSVSSARRHAHAFLSGADASDLGRYIDYIIDEFERHEDAERKLLQEFFSRDREIELGTP